MPSGSPLTTAQADLDSDAITLLDDKTAENHKPAKAGKLDVFRDMPVVVKICTLWLLFIFLGAIYAKLDTTVFNGSLPLADPNSTGFDPTTGGFSDVEKLEAPSSSHILGTDTLKRDTFARVMHGGWVSMIVSVVSALCGVFIGGFIGSLVGFVRGKTETVIMAVMDVILAFPALVLLLALVSVFEVRNLFIIAGVIGFLSIPTYTRVARANALAISNREFVLAARAIGTKPTKILFREIIPNVLPTLISYSLVAAAYVIVVEGSLSFLGLSVSLPTATWGNMINQARTDITINVQQILFPSLALVFTVLSLNQVGDYVQRRHAHRASAL